MPNALARQFALLANRHTGDAQLGGNQQAEQKATRLKAYYHLDIGAGAADMLHEQSLHGLTNRATSKGGENVSANKF